MSSDVEHFYVQRTEPLGPLLPGPVEWVEQDGEYAADGGEWQLLVYEPEPVETDEIPADLRGAVPGLRFSVGATVEPINPPKEAWQLLNAVLDAVGGALGGASYDPDSGRVIAWSNGERFEPA
jgi:hypothetical protein